MLRLALVVAGLAAISGCATRQGIPVATARASKADADDFSRRNSTQLSRASSSGTAPKGILKTELIPDVEGPKLIIIGNIMALTAFDAATLSQRYDTFLGQIAPQQPAFSKDWYLETSAGETAVKYAGLTGVYHRQYKAEIPKDLVGRMGFASAAGAKWVGTSADLVVAQGLPSYGTWITHVLCSAMDPDYLECDSHYQRGVYQSSDGREVDGSLKVINGGATIDVGTFQTK